MSLTNCKSRVFIAMLFCFFIGYMSAVNITLVKSPLIKYINGKIEFRQATKSIETNYTLKQLKYKIFFINTNGFIARITGRRMCNGVLRLKGNTLTGDMIEKDNKLDERLKNAIEFANFTKRLKIPFIYIVGPHKVPTSQDNYPEGVEDFANENTDVFLKGLSDAGVDSLDLRPLLSSTSKQVNKFFYRTDHHWNPDGALVAFQVIMSKIEMLPINKGEFDKEFTNSKLWKRHEKKGWFLGSHGKRVGTLFAGTDSLIWYTPKFTTKMSLVVPHHKQIYKGNFTTANIRNQYIQTRDYFNYNAYCVYIGGDYPLVHHRNLKAPNKMKVLILKDSFVLPLQAFMSTEFSELDVIDPRHYKASTIAEYIMWTKPDLVLMVRCANSTGDYFGFNNCVVDRFYPYQREEALVKDYNVLLTASKMDSVCKRIPIPLHAGNTYSVSFKNIVITRGKTDGVCVALYDSKKKKIIQQEIFDVEFCNKSNVESKWTFRVPEEESDYSLFVYAGIPGNTKNIGAEYKGINVSLLN